MKKDNQVGGDHYNTPIQHYQFVTANDTPWCEANAMKYLMRHMKKNGSEDLAKALHYTLMAAEVSYGVEGCNKLIREFCRISGVSKLLDQLQALPVNALDEDDQKMLDFLLSEQDESE